MRLYGVFVSPPRHERILWIARIDASSAEQRFACCTQDYIVFLALTTNTNTANLEAAAAVTVSGAPGSAQDPHYFAAPVDCAYSDAAAAMEAYETSDADAK